MPLVANHRDLNYMADSFFSFDYDVQHRQPPRSANLTTIRPPFFTVQVVVGAGDSQPFYKLELDLVGGLTWMQCKPCTPRLLQESPIFDPARSPHYAYIAPGQPYCQPPYSPAGRDDRCNFDATLRNATAHGDLGRDDFTFAGSSGGTEVLPNVAFGCAHTTQGFQYVNFGALAGALGMNSSPASLIRQLLEGDGVAQFSYCLTAHPKRQGFLRFGGDVPHPPNELITALMDLHPGDDARAHMYRVSIGGVLLDGRKLTGITAAMFNGGCAVDVGTPKSTMVKPAYDVLEREVEAHLARLGVRAVPQLFEHLPTVGLEFLDEATLTMGPELLFMEVSHGGAKHECFLVVVPDDRSTVLGSIQQLYKRFTFDLKANKMFFAPEDCHLDTPQAA